MAIYTSLVRFPGDRLEEVFDLDGFHRVTSLPGTANSTAEGLTLGKFTLAYLWAFSERAVMDAALDAASARTPFEPTVPPRFKGYHERRNQELYAKDIEARYSTPDEVRAIAARLEAAAFEDAAVKSEHLAREAQAREWAIRLRSFYREAARDGQAVVSIRH